MYPATKQARVHRSLLQELGVSSGKTMLAAITLHILSSSIQTTSYTELSLMALEMSRRVWISSGLDKDSLSWILWNAFSLWIFELDKLFWNLISIERSVNVWVLEFDFQSVPTSHPRTIKTTIINGAWLRWWPKLWALGGHQSVF